MRMPTWMWPNRVDGRLQLAVVLAFLSFLLLIATVYVFDRTDDARYRLAKKTYNRIDAVVRLIELYKVDDYRDMLIDAVRSPIFRVKYYSTRKNLITSTSGDMVDEINKQLQKHELTSSGRKVAVSTDKSEVEKYWKRAGGRALRRYPLDLLESRRKVVIMITLSASNDGLLVFVVPTEFTSWQWAIRVALWTVGVGTVSALLLILFLYRAMDRVPDRVSHNTLKELPKLMLLIDGIEDRARRIAASSTIIVMAETLRAKGWETVDLAETARLYCENAGTAKGNEIVRYVGPDRVILRLSAVAAHHVFANLVENAVRHGRGGDVDGDVEVELAEDDDAVLIAVRDRGPGMSKADRDGGFVSGPGRGLKIVQEQAKRCGGDIALRNRADGGLEVTVTMPKRGFRRLLAAVRGWIRI